MNGGKCEIKNQKAVCVCNDKFTGDYCEKSEWKQRLNAYSICSFNCLLYYVIK